MKGYIYKITNLVTSDFYIGQTKCIRRRKNDHSFRLRKGEHFNSRLQRSWNKHGEENFEFSVLEEYSFPNTFTYDYIREYLSCMEIYYISKLNPRYNIMRVIHESVLGYKLSDEHKEKVRIGNLGRKCTREQIEKAIKTRRETAEKNGYWFSPEQLEMRKEITEKMQKSRIGTKHSYEARIKISQAERGSNSKIVARKNGKIIGVFSMVCEAAEFLGLKRTAISNNLNGRSKLCSGILFTYENINNE